MLIFSIIIYTLFGGMCIWFIISGVQKIKQIRIEQEASADQKEEQTSEKEAGDQENKSEESVS